MGVNAMECMKCGREILAGDVFCDICLKDMAKYPVKPGTVVHIPKREPRRPVERRTTVSLEKQIEVLKIRNRVLSLLLVLSICLIIGMGIWTMGRWADAKEDVAAGQNYSVSQSDSTGTGN